MADSIRQAAEDQIARLEDKLLDLESELSLYTHTDDPREKACFASICSLEKRIGSLKELL